MQQPTRTGLRLVLAAAIAAMGVQVGRLSWRSPDETRGATRIVYAAPRYPRDTVPTNGALGSSLSALRGEGGVAISEQRAESREQRASEATGPRSSFVGPQMPVGGGFFLPPGPDYGGKPLPLPSQDQLRFLARRGLLGPDGQTATLNPVDALRIAPPGTDGRPTTNDRTTLRAAPPTTNDPGVGVPTRPTTGGRASSRVARMIGPPVPVRLLAGALGSPVGLPFPGTMAKANGVASPAPPGKVTLARPQSGNVTTRWTAVGGNVASGVPSTAVGGNVASGVRDGQGGNVTSGARDGVASNGTSSDARAVRTRVLSTGPQATETPAESQAATLVKPGAPAGDGRSDGAAGRSPADQRPTTNDRTTLRAVPPTTSGSEGTNGGSAAGGEGRQPATAPAVAAPPLHLRLTVTGVGEGVGPGRLARVRVTASAPCHLALYRIDAGGRISAILSLAGAARMRAAASYSLAATMQTGDRLVALGSRRPLSGREAQTCLKAFLAEGGESDPAPSPDAVPLPLALQRLAAVAGGHPGPAPGEALARSAWAVTTAALPAAGAARGADAGVGAAPG